MTLIDTHCHFYLPEFEADQDRLAQEAKDAGIRTIYLPAIDAETDNRLLALADRYPGFCEPMMGLHPCSVNKEVKSSLDRVRNWLTKRSFSAIGEAGLDFYWDKQFVPEQYHALEQQMEWALEWKLPIVLHTRDAMNEAIELTRPYAQKGLTGIFHCFGGTYEQGRAILDLGFALGIGGVVTYKKSGLAETLARLPLEGLVLETDAPYLTPVPHRGKRNVPAYLAIVAEAVAAALSVPIETVAAQTSLNAERIFTTHAS